MSPAALFFPGAAAFLIPSQGHGAPLPLPTRLAPHLKLPAQPTQLWLLAEKPRPTDPGQREMGERQAGPGRGLHRDPHRVILGHPGLEGAHRLHPPPRSLAFRPVRDKGSWTPSMWSDGAAPLPTGPTALQQAPGASHSENAQACSARGRTCRGHQHTSYGSGPDGDWPERRNSGQHGLGDILPLPRPAPLFATPRPDLSRWCPRWPCWLSCPSHPTGLQWL